MKPVEAKPDPMKYQAPPGVPVAALIHEREMMKADPLGLIRGGYLRIKTKDMDIIPFMPNSSQNRILDAIQKARKAHKPVRIAVLKARQMGVSTLSQAILYAFSSLRANINSFVIADDEDGASALFKMNEIFWEFMDKLHRHMCPRKKNSSEKKLEFDKKRSLIRIETANNRRAGRKYTLHLVHASEVGFWPRFRETMRGMMQAVADRPETIVILETTANGTNDFCKFWRRIERDHKDGTTQWTPIFLPWNEHAEYQRPFTTGYERDMFESSLTGKEVELRKEFNLTMEQLHWRRWKISNDFTGDEEGFEVEFPLSPEQAFKSTAKNVFPEKVIKAHQSNIAAPRMVGDLYMDDRRPVFMPSKDGHLRIFELPKAGHRYVIGVDSCEGSTRGDFAACEVIDRTTWTQVATLHGRIPPEIIGQLAFDLGIYYKMALVCPELNGPGFSTVSKLTELGYPNLCRRKKSVIDEKSMSIIETEEIGWRTDAKSKGIIVREMAEGLRNLLFVIKNQATLDEFSNYVVKDVAEDGHVKYGADEGYQDDRAIALMIAQHYARNLPDFEPELHEEMPIMTRITGYG